MTVVGFYVSWRHICNGNIFKDRNSDILLLYFFGHTPGTQLYEYNFQTSSAKFSHENNVKLSTSQWQFMTLTLALSHMDLW